MYSVPTVSSCTVTRPNISRASIPLPIHGSSHSATVSRTGRQTLSSSRIPVIAIPQHTFEWVSEKNRVTVLSVLHLDWSLHFLLERKWVVRISHNTKRTVNSDLKSDDIVCWNTQSLYQLGTSQFSSPLSLCEISRRQKSPFRGHVVRIYVFSSWDAVDNLFFSMSESCSGFLKATNGILNYRFNKVFLSEAIINYSMLCKGILSYPGSFYISK